MVVVLVVMSFLILKRVEVDLSLVRDHILRYMVFTVLIYLRKVLLVYIFTVYWETLAAVEKNLN